MLILETKCSLTIRAYFSLLFYCGQGPPSFFRDQIKEEKMAEITFLVEGIVCTGCAMDMESILRDMDGVQEALVNFREGLFSITYNPEEIEAKTIVKKVKNLGFKTKILTE